MTKENDMVLRGSHLVKKEKVRYRANIYERIGTILDELITFSLGKKAFTGEL